MSGIEYEPEPGTSSFLQQMDNKGFEKEKKNDAVEMGEVRASNGSAVMGCTDACIAMHQQHQQYYPPTQQQLQQQKEKDIQEGPWHPLKTTFLIIVVAVFIIWIILYSIFGSLNLL